jgi:transcriptional regulator with XRE-family HTH domain
MSMTGEQMRMLRERRGETQEEFGIVLGLPRETVVGYEKGTRNGRPQTIPRSVELACAALANGIMEYSDPSDELKIDVFRLMTSSGLRPDVFEWLGNNLKGAVVVYNNTATFSNVSDAVKFKLMWSDDLFG